MPESDSQNSPLVVLANDETGGAGTAFGYGTLSALRGAIAVTDEDQSTLGPANPVGPGPWDTTDGSQNVDG